MTANEKGVAGKQPQKAPTILDDSRLAYSMREVADMLGTSERSVYTWIQQGKLGYFKINRLVRVPREAIDALMRGAS